MQAEQAAAQSGNGNISKTAGSHMLASTQL